MNCCLCAHPIKIILNDYCEICKVCGQELDCVLDPSKQRDYLRQTYPRHRPPQKPKLYYDIRKYHNINKPRNKIKPTLSYLYSKATEPSVHNPI